MVIMMPTGKANNTFMTAFLMLRQQSSPTAAIHPGSIILKPLYRFLNLFTDHPDGVPPPRRGGYFFETMSFFFQYIRSTLTENYIVIYSRYKQVNTYFSILPAFRQRDCGRI